MNDLVSIITPSYNTAKYIGETIQSVIDQTYTNWEMIIVDDCSTDNTDEVVKKYLVDNRIRYYKNKVNNGAAESRNLALRNANGKWIAFLDSDDLWSSRKLEKQIRFMEKNGLHFSYTCYEEIKEDSVSNGILVSGPSKISKQGMNNYCWMGCLTVMYDAEYIGLVQIEDIKKNNDYAMWLKVCKKADCYLLNENLAKYRKRSGSISNQRYSRLIYWHYRLFRVVEKKSVFLASLHTIRNLLFGVIKKLVYVNKIN